jgi:peptide/nickel transport system permease protein
MAAFLFRRLLSAVPVLFGILLVTFVLARSIPGDPCRAVLGERATDAVCDAFIVRNGLDQPVLNQFAIYIRNISQGDLGDSFRFTRPVSTLLAERLPPTIELTITALIFAVSVGIPLGIISAYRHNSAVDVGTMIGANLGVSMPVFWLGLMLSFFFSVTLKNTIFALPPSGPFTPGFTPDPYYVQWGWLPSRQDASVGMVFLSNFGILNGLLLGDFNVVGDAVRHLILPAITVGTIPLAIIARMTRSSLLESLGQDYIRTARAKGLQEHIVVFKHAMRNSLLPIVTIIGLNFGYLLSGAVLTETVFGLTGIGRTLFEGITARDYSIVQGVTLVTAIGFVLINLLIDIIYGYLDPRIRLS